MPHAAARGGRIGLVQFPGSNCDADCADAFHSHFGIALLPIWHSEASLPPLDALILPGGFSYGDYLRSGHLASLSPIMPALVEHARRGGAILGICNGFQILTEAGLLPGALLRNQGGSFLCRPVSLQAEPGQSTYQVTTRGHRLRMPIAHGEGRYYIDPHGLAMLRDRGQIAYTYADANPNGSIAGIAGVVSANGRVLGLMPHPERACESLLGGSSDGRSVLEAFLASFL